MITFDNKRIEFIRNRLVKKQETLAVAESVTSGLLQLAFSQAMEAGKFYQGGITVYNAGQKFKHLQVEPIHADAVNCVSEKVTREMALHVCELFNSDWGIGITGYANPVPESGNKVFAYYAIAHKGKIVKKGMFRPAKDEPLNTQLYYAGKVIEQLSARLRK
jgi:nicotinamide-nucleotide amidase